MILEIPYDKYKYFCSLLPCKDVFYFLKNLFVKFPNDDTVYSIKVKIGEDSEKVYNSLKDKNELITYNLSEFLKGLPTNDNGIYVKEDMYNDKSILVIL